jgi:hypothetical protein
MRLCCSKCSLAECNVQNFSIAFEMQLKKQLKHEILVLHQCGIGLAHAVHYIYRDRCWLWPDIETQGLSMALELWSWYRAVMASVWPWVYGIGLESPCLGLEGPCLSLGLEILTLTTSLKFMLEVLTFHNPTSVPTRSLSCLILSSNPFPSPSSPPPLPSSCALNAVHFRQRWR